MSNEKIVKHINALYELLKKEHKEALQKALDNYLDDRALGYSCGLSYALGMLEVLATEVNNQYE